MQTPVSARRKYRFGLFEADPASGELLRQGVRVRLQDQPFRLLTILLEHAGEVVLHEELRHQLWPADIYVEFDGSLKAALKRLRGALGDPADNPVFIETIPRRGYRFIAPVTIKSTYAKSRESLVATASASHGATPAGSQSTPSVSSVRRFVYVAAVVAVLAGLAWWMFRHPSAEPSAEPSKSSGVVQAAIPVRKSVAILGFHNLSGRPADDWLATALSEMLGTELGSGEKLRLVSGEEVANLRLTSPWPQTGTLGRQTAVRVGTALNSDVLVLGSYTTLGTGSHEQLRLDVSLQDARTGNVLAQIAEAGNRNDLFRFTSELGWKLRRQLGLPPVIEAEETGLLASMPVNPDAARFYALGIAKLRDFDARAAKDLLQQAVAADPKFPLAYAALANAWSQLGYEQKRKEEAKKASDLSGNLPQVEKLQVEGDYYESLPNHEKAASAYSALFELFPDNVDYGLQLADAQNAATHNSEAAVTIARLRRLPSPASQDPRIDLANAHVLTFQRRPDSLALLHTAERKAKAQDKKIIYARARREECMDLIYGEHPDQADAPCKDAYNIYLAAGNNLGAADALRLMADKEGGEGHIPEARATYERALKILRSQGENLKTATILNNMAIIYTNEGNLSGGEQLYREAKLRFERGGDERNASVALANIGDILYLRGDLPGAAATYRQVIDIDSTIEGGSPEYAISRLADLQLTRGQVQEAHRLALHTIEILRNTRTAQLADSMAEFGDILRAEGDLQGARKQYQNALELRQVLGRSADMAQTQESFAELDLDESHPNHAELLARSAIVEFEKEKLVPDATGAYTLLSRSLLQQDKLDDARAAIQHATELARNSPDPALKLPIEIQTARIELAMADKKTTSGARNTAMKRLRSVMASAKNQGYYLIECDVRLAFAEEELKADPAVARSELDAIEKDTRLRSLLLLSNKAHALLVSPKA